MVLTEDQLRILLANNPALRVREFDKAVSNGGKSRRKDEFDSEAERRYYQKYILPLMLSGHITTYLPHKTFELLPPVNYQGHRFRRRVYTPDFYLEYRDGSVEVVEVKGRKIKKLQRDYPLRRHLFLQMYCIPNGWTFKEVHDDET